MRSIWRIRRLQIAGNAITAPCLLRAPALAPCPDLPFQLHSCVAGPSSRPYSTAPQLRTEVHSEAAQNSYFTASRPVMPLASSSPISAATIAEDESDKLAQLHERLSIPASSRTEQVARRTFDLYRSLSPFTRHQLPLDLIRAVLRNVFPSVAQLDDKLPDSPSRSSRNAKSWEDRLKFVIADISASRGPHPPTSTGETAASDCWGDYKFAMNRLARTGSVDAVESIVGDMRLRGILEGQSSKRSLRLHETRLHAIRNRLICLGAAVDMAYKTSIQRHLNRLDEIFPVFWGVVNDLRKDGLVPKQLTCTLIVQIISQFWYALPRAHTQAQHLGELLEEVLQKGYGLDMEYLTVKKTESTADIQAFVVRAIVDHLGRQGNVWKMLSAYEVLTQTSPAETEYRTHWNKEDSDEDDVGPTLAQMEAKEKQERSGLAPWENSSRTESAVNFARIVDQPSDEGEGQTLHWNPFNKNRDYLPSTAVLPSAMISLPSDKLDALAESFDPTDQGNSRNDIFTVMLQHASAARDYPLAQHILRTAMRSTLELRQGWLARMISRARMHHAAARNGTAEWTGIRNLKTPVLKFRRYWFTSLRWLVMSPHRTAIGTPGMQGGGPVAQLLAQLEEAERWLVEETAVLNAPLYPSPTDTAAQSEPLGADSSDRSPRLGDIYDLSTYRAVTMDALEGIRRLHLDAVNMRVSFRAKHARRRAKWIANKKRDTLEAEQSALRVAERKAAGLAERQALKRAAVREVEERDEGMMLAAATT